MSQLSEDAHRVLSSTVARLANKGVRKIMITSSGPGEGKSTITAALGRNLARFGRQGIVLVDVDTIRTTLHRHFQLDNRRGLGELLEEVYHVDLARESPDQFGVGDWIELLRAQTKTGKLEIMEGDEAFSILFTKGRISSLFASRGPTGGTLGEILHGQGQISEQQRAAALRVQAEGGHPLGEVLRGLGYIQAGDLNAALELQVKDRLHRILTMRQPRCRFSETAEAYLPAFSGRLPSDPDGTDIDRFLGGMVGSYLKQPYLSSQVPSYLRDTELDNLKILTSGALTYDLGDTHFSSPFALALSRLAKSFDVVLIDAPPVAFDSATAALSPLMDGVILTVKADGLDAHVIQSAKERLVESGANLLGVVLNQVRLYKDEALPYYRNAIR